MIINQIIPEKIYIENEKDLQKVKEFLNENNYNSNNLQINSWVTLSNKKNYYIVKPGDTISSIAKTLALTEQEILNKIGTKTVFIGQRIRI